MCERNYGIDLLRMVSMLMIIILHLLRFGGIYNAASSTLSRGIISMIDICCICAVNCFAIISGFVGYNKKFKITNLINLWLLVVFYLLSFSIIFIFVPGVNVSYSDILTSFFPIAFNKHWYVTAYFGMYFTIPLINKGIKQLSDRQLGFLSVTFILLFSVISTIASYFSKNSLFELAFGYSPFWLMICYIIGALLKRCGNNTFKKNAKVKWLALYVAGVVVTIGLKLFVELISKKFGYNGSGGEILHYNSPTVLLSAIGLVMFFANLRIQKGWIITFISSLSPMAFSVCVIHTQKQFSDFFIKGHFSFVSTLNPFVIPIIVLLFALIIYFLCSGIDFLRILLFKLLKIKKLSAFLNEKTMSIVNGSFSRSRR